MLDRDRLGFLVRHDLRALSKKARAAEGERGMTEPIQQIVIEMVRKEDGSLGYVWDAFGEEHRLFGGSASSLSDCLDSMRDYLRNEGYATKDRLEPGVDKLGVPFWSCPGCGKQWIKTQRNYCPKCRFGMGAE
jgi:hypothetical protein